MELPELGEQCQADSCGRLDFLPVKCYGCHKKFCNDHWQYETHNCPARHTKDVQVPVCPLCDKPVPTAKGVSPDTTVSAHIDRDCQSDPAVKKRNRVYVNRCTVKKCKQKEMMKIECDQCKQSFCLKHRHPEDHDCQNKPASSSPKATAAASKASHAALARQEQTRNTSSIGSAIRSTASTASNRIMGQSSIRSFFQTQPTQSTSTSLSEDEALARALQASMNEQQTSSTSNRSNNQTRIVAPTTTEEQDLMLAQALAESEREANRTSSTNQQSSTSAGNGDKSCTIC